MKSRTMELGEGAYARVFDYQDDEGSWAMKHYTMYKGSGLSAAYREVEMLSYLKHPNVVELHSIHVGAHSVPPRKKSGVRTRSEHVVDGELHIVMEKGDITLQRKMEKRMDMTTIIRITRDILLGLEYIHMNGIVHRDLSDANVLIMSDGRACICDFGMSKHHLSEVEVNDTYVHPFARSPEMHARDYYDFRSDIWSVGVLVASMILGSNPFATNGDYISQLIRSIPLCPDLKIIRHWLKKCLRSTDTMSHSNNTISNIDVSNYEGLVAERMSHLKSPIESIDNELARDFLECCLSFHRKHRQDASSLLEHRWLRSEKDFITVSRTAYLNVTVPNARNWRSVQLPPSSVRGAIKKYITSNQHKFADQVDRRTSRICLALNMYYRVISYNHSDDVGDTIRSDLTNGYALALFVVCVIVTLKYCATNSVPRVARLVPNELGDVMDEHYIKQRELIIMAALKNVYYQHTAYDVLIQRNIRVTEETSPQVWMRYLGGITRECNIEVEYEEYVKTMIENGGLHRDTTQQDGEEGGAVGSTKEQMVREDSSSRSPNTIPIRGSPGRD